MQKQLSKLNTSARNAIYHYPIEPRYIKSKKKDCCAYLNVLTLTVNSNIYFRLRCGESVISLAFVHSTVAHIDIQNI